VIAVLFATAALQAQRTHGGPLDRLPRARVVVDSQQHRIVIELPPTDLPARTPPHDMAVVLLPVYSAEMPISGAIFRAHIEVRDAAGNELPGELLHHFNLADPDHRELFLPIGLHMMAAGRETPRLAVPRLVFGLPLQRGQRFIASAMLVNPGAVAYRQIRVQLVLSYQPDNGPWPVFPAFPWVMDVLFPLGREPHGNKAFDLAPGRSTHSWESSPAIPGTIVGLGGHLHDYGIRIELADATTGTVLWHAAPIKDSAGHVVSIPTSLLANWHRLGVHILPAHRYRVTALYDNPTGHVLHNGGMGLVGGLFVPDRGTRWPGVDPTDTLYQRDLMQTLRVDHSGADAMLHMGHMGH
jgi:hypothetical protein